MRGISLECDDEVAPVRFRYHAVSPGHPPGRPPGGARSPASPAGRAGNTGRPARGSDPRQRCRRGYPPAATAAGQQDPPPHRHRRSKRGGRELRRCCRAAIAKSGRHPLLRRHDSTSACIHRRNASVGITSNSSCSGQRRQAARPPADVDGLVQGLAGREVAVERADADARPAAPRPRGWPPGHRWLKIAFAASRTRSRLRVPGGWHLVSA